MQQIDLGRRLRRERERLRWTQGQLADKIGYTTLSINRWEHGKTKIRQDAIDQLSKAFGKPPERWGIGYWHVPLLRNPYFTGREQTLLRLHKALAAENTRSVSQTRAISGLGGIGKTQTALEYACRYADEYEAVLWVQADSRETLISDFAELASTLNLPEKEETNQFQVIGAVKRWLEEHGPWLLIFDNADDLNVVSDFLPRLPVGARLLTARTQITGMYITKTELEKMSLEESLSFLVRRSTSSEEKDYVTFLTETELQTAQELWQVMDGLPLALDQAAAYIEATQCSFRDYADLYRLHRKDLLGKRGKSITTYSDSVATTWSLSFKRVEQKNPDAAELLWLCAFLSPDAIPEELLTWGRAHSASPLQAQAASTWTLNEAISVLLAYSLVRRDRREKTLSIHRLVQAVLQDTLDAATRRTWVERAMLAVHEAFPDPPFKEWTQCERLLPHVLACAAWIEREQLSTLQASFLFDKAGSYLRERGQYTEAEHLLSQSLAICEQHPEEEHFLATSLSNLAGLYSYQGKYTEAERLVERALSIRKRVVGVEHPDTATSLSHLAILFTQQGKHREAEPLYTQALAIYTQHLGADHLEVARTLSNLAVLYEDQGQYRQAEQLHERALAIYELRLEPYHPAIARSLGNLALISWKLGRYEQAKVLYERALSIQGSESPDAAYSLFGLAEIAREQGKFEQAEILYQQVLAIRDQHLEAEHPDRAEALQGLADVYREQSKYAEAEQFYHRALRIWEQQFGPESLQMTHSLSGLADVYREQSKYAEAEQFYHRALHIRQHSVNPRHPDTAETMYGLARLWDTQGNRKQARSWYSRTLAIREQLLGVDHPKTTETRTRLFALLQTMGEYEEVAPFEWNW